MRIIALQLTRSVIQIDTQISTHPHKPSEGASALHTDLRTLVAPHNGDQAGEQKLAHQIDAFHEPAVVIVDPRERVHEAAMRRSARVARAGDSPDGKGKPEAKSPMASSAIRAELIHSPS